MVIDKLVFRYRFLEKEIAPPRSKFLFPSDFDKSEEILPEGYTNLPNNRFFES
jgi:hypothetical protein